MKRPVPRWRMWFARPWFSVGLALFLVWNACQQPWDSFECGGRTIVGALAFSIRDGSLPYGYLPTDRYLARRVGDSWIVERRSELFDYNADYVVVKHDEWNKGQGLWSAVYLEKTDRIIMYRDWREVESPDRDRKLAVAPEVPLSDRTLIYAELAKIRPQRFTPERMAEDLAGGRASITPLWLGILNDALVVLTFGALWLSRMGWIRVAAKLNRRFVRWWRGPEYLCPHCRYDLRASPRGPCPECGKARSLYYSNRSWFR